MSEPFFNVFTSAFFLSLSLTPYLNQQREKRREERKGDAHRLRPCSLCLTVADSNTVRDVHTKGPTAAHPWPQLLHGRARGDVCVSLYQPHRGPQDAPAAPGNILLDQFVCCALPRIALQTRGRASCRSTEPMKSSTKTYSTPVTLLPRTRGSGECLTIVLAYVTALASHTAHARTEGCKKDLSPLYPTKVCSVLLAECCLWGWGM
jgi:hypothetical protein